MNMCRVRRIFLVVIVLSLTGIGKTFSEDKPAIEPAPATTSNQTPKPLEDNSISDEFTSIENTIDETHKRVELGILNQTIRLDNFFGNAKPENQQEAEYVLRWRNSVRIEQGGRIKFGTSALANFIFPRISERLNLSITGENEPQPVAQSLPEDPGNPGLDRTFQTNARIVNTELRYGLIRTPSMNLFLGAGVRLVIPTEAFVRSRFQYTYNFSDVLLVHFAETVFAKNTIGPGETTEINFERLLNQKTILRWANSETVSSEINGVEWGTELSLIRELSSKDAISFTGGVYGNTSIDDWVTNYRIFTLYRRNFLRSWLYYEIEPEISWPRNTTGNFSTNYAMTFRIEVVFRGVAAKKVVKTDIP